MLLERCPSRPSTRGVVSCSSWERKAFSSSLQGYSSSITHQQRAVGSTMSPTSAQVAPVVFSPSAAVSSMAFLNHGEGPRRLNVLGGACPTIVTTGKPLFFPMLWGSLAR